MSQHNALSRSMEQVPMWLVQAVVGLLLSCATAWATWASVTAWKHDTRLGVIETKVDTERDNISDIKQGVKETDQKLDRLIESQIEQSRERHRYEGKRVYGR